LLTTAHEGRSFFGGLMKYTAKDLADAVGAIIEGDGSTEVGESLPRSALLQAI